MQDAEDATHEAQRHEPWNKGKLIDAKPPLRPKHVWSIRRSWMMALGKCSPAEYRRMLSEKALAAYHSGLALASPRRKGTAAVLAPWHKRSAKRLRRK